jgi:hypothetical protein
MKELRKLLSIDFDEESLHPKKKKDSEDGEDKEVKYEIL